MTQKCERQEYQGYSIIMAYSQGYVADWQSDMQYKQMCPRPQPHLCLSAEGIFYLTVEDSQRLAVAAIKHHKHLFYTRPNLFFTNAKYTSFFSALCCSPLLFHSSCDYHHIYIIYSDFSFFLPAVFTYLAQLTLWLTWQKLCIGNKCFLRHYNFLW